MMTLIDYRGFRLIAVSVLPMGTMLAFIFKGYTHIS